MTHAIRPVDFDNLKTMTYEVTDRVARITFNRPDKGNAIIADTPLELSALVERADLDPNVHVILVSGRGEGFCAGFDHAGFVKHPLDSAIEEDGMIELADLAIEPQVNTGDGRGG